MQERRVVFSIGVTYQTPREKVAAIPSMIKAIIEATERVLPEGLDLEYREGYLP